jgi:hypothetical protein
MSRNALAFGGVLLVGALLWMVTAWPARQDDDSADVIPDEPAAPQAPPPPAAEPKPQAEPPAPPPAAPPPAAPATPQPQEQPAPAEPDDTDMFREAQGPVAERKRTYESEPRDSAATEAESVVRKAFQHPDGAPDLFKSVLCRQTVCKIELRWTPDRLGAYVAGMTRASVDFEPEIAVSPAGPPGPDQTKPIEVYLKRKPPSAAN